MEPQIPLGEGVPVSYLWVSGQRGGPRFLVIEFLIIVNGCKHSWDMEDRTVAAKTQQMQRMLADTMPPPQQTSNAKKGDNFEPRRTALSGNLPVAQWQGVLHARRRLPAQAEARVQLY